MVAQKKTQKRRKPRRYKFHREETPEARNKRLANLIPWKPGQSGNKSGRPRKIFTEAYQYVAGLRVDQLGIHPKDTVALAAAKAVAQQMVAGKLPAVIEVANRVDGMPKATVGFEGGEGEPTKAPSFVVLVEPSHARPDDTEQTEPVPQRGTPAA